MSTIKQRSKPISIGGDTPREITVRRFAWGAAVAFSSELAKVLSEHVQFFQPKAAAVAPDATDGVAGVDVPATEPAARSRIAEFIPLLPALVLSSDNLVKLLISGATDLKRDDVAALDLVDTLKLAEASLDLNFDDEVKNSFAGVLAKAMAAGGFRRMTSGAGSTPT